MKLAPSERFSNMAHSHQHRAVVLITKVPSQGQQVRAYIGWLPEVGRGSSRQFEIGMERVILGAVDITESLENIGTLVRRSADDAMAGALQFFDIGAMIDAQRLEAEADAEDGKQFRVTESPELVDEANVLGVSRVTGSGPDDNAIHGPK